MGSSRTPKYVFEIETFLSRAGKVRHTSMEWKREYGCPTVANLDKWVTKYEDSCKPGGCNAHLGVDPVVSAKIRLNHSGSPAMVEWERNTARPNEPKFQVF